MPSDAVRSTRSGRITKQTSKSSLANKSAASSTSRSRPRERSSNLQTSLPNRAKSRPNVSTTRHQAAAAAAVEDLIAEEQEQIRRILARRKDPEDDRQSIYDSLVARREALEAEEEEDTHRGRSSNRTHRRHQSPRSTSSSTSPALRTSFKETDGKITIPSISLRFPAVSKTHIENIYRCKFDVRNLLQLGNSFGMVTSKEANEIESTPRLLRCVETYCHIVCHFASPRYVNELQIALSQFRLKLLEHLEVYTFTSVREWCLCVIATRISTGQDDPIAWMNGAPDLQYKLTPKPKPMATPLRSASSSMPRSDNICRNFNKGNCTLAACKYQHTCSSCGNGSHPAARCQKAASGSNTTPLADRVQRP